MEIGIIISGSAVAVSILALLGGIIYWAGRVSERIDALAERIEAQGARLDARIDTVTERLDARIDALTERLDALSTEVVETRRELLAAVSRHEHDADGNVIFRVPPAG